LLFALTRSRLTQSGPRMGFNLVFMLSVDSGGGQHVVPSPGIIGAAAVGLQSVRHHPIQQVARKVRGWGPPQHGMPTAAKLLDVEIAQSRDLDAKRFTVRQRRTDG
jgi:hypothetical protein